MVATTTGFSAAGSRIDSDQAAADRLAALAHGYVLFAAASPALFKLLYEADLDKASYPEVEAAEKPVTGAVLACVRAVTGGSDQHADDLATAVEATARGFALLLLDGDFGRDSRAIERAAGQAARAAAALIEARHLLTPAQRGGATEDGRRSPPGRVLRQSLKRAPPPAHHVAGALTGAPGTCAEPIAGLAAMISPRFGGEPAASEPVSWSARQGRFRPWPAGPRRSRRARSRYVPPEHYQA